MAKFTKKVFPRDTMMEAAKQIITSSATEREVTETYGVKLSQLRSWVKVVREKGDEAFKSSQAIYASLEVRQAIASDLSAGELTQAQVLKKHGIEAKSASGWIKSHITTAKAMLPAKLETANMMRLMQGFMEGKIVQSRLKDAGTTWATDRNPTWDFLNKDYRFKPSEPRIYFLRISNRTGRAYSTKPTDPKGVRFIEDIQS